METDEDRHDLREDENGEESCDAERSYRDEDRVDERTYNLAT
jgi:hypothetical protein